MIFAGIGLATIAFVWRGMYAMSVLQTWGFPIFVGLLIWALLELQGQGGGVGPEGWAATGVSGEPRCGRR